MGKNERLYFSTFAIIIVLSLLLSKISSVFAYIALVSFIASLGLAGIIKMKYENDPGRQYGKSLFLLALFVFCGLFVKANEMFRVIALISLVLSGVIAGVAWSKDASKSVKKCTIWFFSIPFIIGLISIEISSQIVDLKPMYQIIIYSLVYCLLWVWMARVGEMRTTRTALIVCLVFAGILYMSCTFIIDLLPPNLMNIRISQINSMMELGRYGYTIKEVTKIFVELITFPMAILASVSFLVIKKREG